ncbi:putative diphosphate--fructose-6-phosphate 1-phosphotransferase [Helianthus annuus]|nr:putative diphosphate--fructose-6-phosphate 1-phosphotransferase [Helianthus annuus]
MAPLPNGGGKSPMTSRLTSVYSEVQNSRLDHPLALPSIFRNPFKVVDGPASSAAGNPGLSEPRLGLGLAWLVYDPIILTS